MNVEESLDYRLGEEPATPAASWDRYVSGVSRVLRLQGHALRGVEAVAHSTVPIGGGLSSSASLLVSVCHMHQAAGGFHLDPKQTALACQQAENQDAGVICGILDHYSACFGLAGTALLLDCRSLTHVEVRIPSDIRVVICDTNYPRTLAGSEYAKRRQECDEGTRLLQAQDPSIRTLRDVNTPLFERLKEALPETLRKRCQFIFEENQRVVAFMAALVRDDREAMRRAVRGLLLRGAGPVREDRAGHGADVRGHDGRPRRGRRPAVRGRVRRLHAGLRAGGARGRVLPARGPAIPGSHRNRGRHPRDRTLGRRGAAGMVRP